MPESRKENSKNKPVKKFQLRGISASIFENRSEKGSPFHKVSITRTYKDGDEFKTTGSFGRDDLPLVEALARQSWFEILKREAKARSSSDEE
ncbi:hypothetical protein [Stratiformator vulcanicus]|nr:hypothetical protein [Stratiformator vulcanicus]